MAGTVAEMEVAAANRRQLLEKQYESVERRLKKIAKLLVKYPAGEKVVVGITKGAKTLDQMASEVETPEAAKKRVEFLKRRVKKDRVEIFRLEQAIGEKVVVGVTQDTSTQDQADVASTGDKPAESLKKKKKRVWPSAEASDYLLNHPPMPYKGAPGAIGCEAEAALDRLYKRSVSMREQLISKGYLEF